MSIRRYLSVFFRTGPKVGHSMNYRRPCLEVLEDRVLFVRGVWTGMVSTDYFDPNNWKGKTVPMTAADTAVFGGGVVVNNCEVKTGLPLDIGTIIGNFVGHSLKVNAPVTIHKSLQWHSGIIGGWSSLNLDANASGQWDGGSIGCAKFQVASVTAFEVGAGPNVSAFSAYPLLSNGILAIQPAGKVLWDGNLVLSHAQITNAGTLKAVGSNLTMFLSSPGDNSSVSSKGDIIIEQAPQTGNSYVAIQPSFSAQGYVVRTVLHFATVSVFDNSTLALIGGGESKDARFYIDKPSAVSIIGMKYTFDGCYFQAIPPVGFNSAGTLNVFSSVVFQGSDSFDEELSVNITGSYVTMDGGPMDFKDGATLNLKFSVMQLLNLCRLSIQKTATLNWYSSRVGADPRFGGFLNVDQGATLEMTSSPVWANVLDSVSIRNYGGMNMQDTVLGMVGSKIVNYASMNLIGSGSVYDVPPITGGPEPGEVDNKAGAQLNKIGAGTFIVKETTNNEGLIDIHAGVLKDPSIHNMAGGRVDLSGGKSDEDGFLDLQGGALSNAGSREVIGDVVNTAAQVQPGEAGSPGILTIDGLNGTYSQAGGGSLAIDIGGLTVGSGFDQLNVAGQATLAGTLAVNLIGGYTPNVGDTFQIMTYGSHTGNFQTVTGQTFGTKRFDLQYSATDLKLVVVTAGGSGPTVTALGTSSGPTTGGTSVTITGTNFTDVNGVSFGSVPATSFTVNSSTSITAIAPPEGAATVDVTVTTANGTSGTSSADRFTYTLGAGPTVSGVSPALVSTAGTTQVTVTGTNFQGVTAVDFGTSPAAFFFANSATQITAIAPAQAAGTVDVTVTTYGGTSGTSSADRVTYTGTPVVTGISPTSGTTGGGTTVTISGSSFTSATWVFFGKEPASKFTINTDSTITAVSPPQAAGTYDVTVTSATGTSGLSSADRYTYVGATAPAVTGVSPNSGPVAGGTTVTVTGTNFTGASSVMFGSVAATNFIVNSDSQITAISPPEASATVDVTVTTLSGASAAVTADHFTFTSGSSPTVTAVSPNSGSTGGGTVVTVSGSGFTGASAVSFGGVAATGFSVMSDSSLVATAPPEAAGTVDIQVTAPGGTSAPVAADHFTYNAASAPVVTGVSPSGGSDAGGTFVTITGSGFTGASAVNFGGSGADFTVLSDTAIRATSPAGPSPTQDVMVDITVTTPSGTSATGSADQFIYHTFGPLIAGLGTTSGSTAGGSVVTITGSGFTGATDVLFGGVSVAAYGLANPSAGFVVNSDTQMTVVAPPQAAGTIDVTVVGFAGSSATSSSDRFSYTAASTPAVTSLGTSSGTTAGGTSVTITGTNFSGATAVLFGTVPAASFIVNADTSITAVSPPQAAGTVDVTVTTATGTSASTSSDHFTVTNASAPAVASLGTTSGSTGGGTSVTITGSGFTGTTAVNFGSVAATFRVNSDTSITAVAPAQAAGTVDVTVTTYSGTSATGSGDRFTYNAGSAPSVTSVTPNSGPTTGGTPVVILGSNFTGATAVTFGGVAAPSFTVNADGSVTAMPPLLATGTVDVKVTTPSGTSSAGTADHYTYTNVTAPAPAVSGVSPNSGGVAGGRAITVTGTNFSGATAVSFGSTQTTAFTINSDSSITVTTPPVVTPGTVDIKVTTNNGTSAVVSADQFTFVSALSPTVNGVSPGSGSTAGGTSVTISGNFFTGATAVSFGGVAASSFTVNSGMSITATSPPLPAGTYDITVTTPSGTSSPSTLDRFTSTVAAAPTVTSLGTTSGSTAGGTSVTITGTSLTGATGVFFSGVPAASFTVVSGTQITAVSPPQAAGTIDVTVSTYSGTTATNGSDRYSFTAAATPAVTSLGTSSGTTAGGTSVTITGTNFTGATAVMFGTVPAAGFTVTSGTSITAVSPPQAAGTYDITVTTYTGTSASTSSDHFTVTNAAAPTVTSLGTTSGSTGGGTTVTITGTGFTGATAVSFGSVAAASLTVNSSTSITATSPPHAAGTVDVTVTTYSGTSATGSGDRFTYTAAAAPAVTGVSPSSGSAAGGTLVTVTGSNFTGASAVNFGGVAALSFTVLSDNALTALAPAGTAGTVDITVTTPTGTSTTGSADHFVYNAVAVPTVTAVSPSSGTSGGGTTVTLTGTGFSNATGVSFGSVPTASFVIVSDTTLTATAPPQAAGSYDITVSDYGGSSATSSSDRYTYTAASAPAVTAVSPGTGSTAGGTVVTLTGSGFTGASAVRFGTVVASSFTVNSDTSITATAPSQAAATVDIVVTTPTGSSATGSADQFAYTAAAAPAITGLSLTTGSTGGGTVVTITGSGFTGATAVQFGTVAAGFTVNGDGRVTATAPPQAAGTVDVTVTTPSGTSSTGSADRFTYSAAAAPAVSAVTPSSGSTAGGTTVTITGSGFTGASAVKFGSTAATSFTVLSDTALTALAPAGTVGTVDITVTTPSGTSSLVTADHFAYTAPAAPAVTAVSPSSGTTAGGTVVIVTGSGFTGASAVSFGAYAAMSFTVNSDTQLTAVAPPQAAATVDVTVTTVAGTSTTGSADHFAYSAAAAPAVTGVSLNSGATGGGMAVSITGSGFTGATAVYFGSIAATSFAVNTDGSIFAIVPPEAPGTVDVTVTTPSGTSSTGTADRFTYNAVVPAVTAVSPSSGPKAGGTLVTITGSGFLAATLVWFGAIPVPVFTALSDTTITVNAPVDPLTGTVDITVTDSAGTSTTSTADRFTYT